MSSPASIWTWRVLLAALLWACTAMVRAEPQTVESQVKAAFLYKFGSYVEWPAQSFDKPDSPFVIGVVDADGFAQVVEQTVSGRSVNGHPIVVQRLKQGETPKGVHILFLPGRQDAATLGNTVAAARGQPVLTVTDAQQGSCDGCMISFVVDNNKVRFDISPEAAESGRLKISARLMSVARKVLGKAAAS